MQVSVIKSMYVALPLLSIWLNKQTTFMYEKNQEQSRIGGAG